MARTVEKYRLDREIIAMRVAKELQDGDVGESGHRHTFAVLAVRAGGPGCAVPQ